MKILLTLLLLACGEPTKVEPAAPCTGHYELYNNFPESRGSGTEFRFFHSIIVQGEQAKFALYEVWKDDEGFTEEQFTCVGELGTFEHAYEEQGIIHADYVASNDPDKATKAIDCAL